MAFDGKRRGPGSGGGFLCSLRIDGLEIAQVPFFEIEPATDVLLGGIEVGDVDQGPLTGPDIATGLHADRQAGDSGVRVPVADKAAIFFSRAEGFLNIPKFMHQRQVAVGLI